MTESQIKQLAVQSEVLKKQLDLVESLESKLRPLTNDVFERSSDSYKCDAMGGMYSALRDLDRDGVKNMLIQLANNIIEEKRKEIENISLLTILSEIEKG